MLTSPRAPDRGGVRRFTARSGEDVVLAMLPFVSKRGIVRAAELWDNEAFESSALYTGPILVSTTTQVRARAFAAGFSPSPVTSETYFKLGEHAAADPHLERARLLRRQRLKDVR